MAVRWYVAYALSYRDIEELMEERGIRVDHATLQRWVVKYAPQLMEKARNVMKPTAGSWRMDASGTKPRAPGVGHQASGTRRRAPGVGHQASGTRPRAPGVGHQETCIKVKGVWTYLYRAVDKFGKTIDIMLSEKRDKPAATRFFAKAIGNTGLPEKVVMDKSGANLDGIE